MAGTVSDGAREGAPSMCGGEVDNETVGFAPYFGPPVSAACVP